MKKSKLWKLSWSDFAKGVITSVASAVIQGLISSLSSGSAPDPKAMALTGAIAGLGYLSKNLMTNSDDNFMTPESQ